jgi:hypothetical protein
MENYWVLLLRLLLLAWVLTWAFWIWRYRRELRDYKLREWFVFYPVVSRVAKWLRGQP